MILHWKHGLKGERERTNSWVDMVKHSSYLHEITLGRIEIKMENCLLRYALCPARVTLLDIIELTEHFFFIAMHWILNLRLHCIYAFEKEFMTWGTSSYHLRKLLETFQDLDSRRVGWNDITGPINVTHVTHVSVTIPSGAARKLIILAWAIFSGTGWPIQTSWC